MQLDAFPRQQVMPLRDTLFNLSSNITNPSFSHFNIKYLGKNLCVFSIRIAEYIARQLNTLTHKRHMFGKIDLNIKCVSLTRVAL
jgi:hypothetical protein